MASSSSTAPLIPRISNCYASVCSPTSRKILALSNVPYQFNNGHLQQDPPPFPPYLFRDVLANDLVVEVTQAVLGEGVKNGLLQRQHLPAQHHSATPPR